MQFISRTSLLSLAVVAAATSACSQPKATQPPVGSLTRNFDLIDPNDGHRYGTVEMDPVNGGKVYDATGRVIGRITPPESKAPETK